jgi:hypothetical protein
MLANANAAMKANFNLMIIILLLVDKFHPQNTCGPDDLRGRFSQLI